MPAPHRPKTAGQRAASRALPCGSVPPIGSDPAVESGPGTPAALLALARLLGRQAARDAVRAGGQQTDTTKQ